MDDGNDAVAEGEHMTFILINETAYATDTAEQITAAQAALTEAGETQAPVFVGHPEGDHHKNGQVLFAATQAQIESLPVRLTTESRFVRHTTVAELHFGRLAFAAEVVANGLTVTYSQGYQFEGEGWTELRVKTTGRTGREVWLCGADRKDFLAAIAAVVEGRTLDEIHAAW